MIEIRIHGRGGQGAVIASKLLACALFQEGKWVQSFPMFGVERRGAPVTAFTRVADEKILLRSNIYHPDYVIVLDATLLSVADVVSGLKPGGAVLLNSAAPPQEFPALSAVRLCTVDAVAVAVAQGLGTRVAPMVNTAILGGFARASGLVRIDSLMQAIREEVPQRPQENAQAAYDAYHAPLQYSSHWQS